MSADDSLQTMSFFSDTLGDLMREKNVNQTVLARNADVNQGQLSKYLRAEARPDAIALERLCRAFDDEGARLAIAYLRDDVPQYIRKRIQITDLAGAGQLSSSLAETRPHVRKLLERAAEECTQRPEFLKALEAFLEITIKG